MGRRDSSVMSSHVTGGTPTERLCLHSNCSSYHGGGCREQLLLTYIKS